MKPEPTVSLREDYEFFDLLIPGVNSTRLYMLTMYSIVRSNEYKRLVELGTFLGNTTAVLARAAELNDGYVWTVDDLRDGTQDRAMDHIAKLGLSHRVKFIEGPSWDSNFVDQVDFVFVDAEHTETALALDWLAWAPKVRKGGVIAFHDACGMRWTENFNEPGWQHVLFPGDSGLLIARKNDQ